MAGIISMILGKMIFMIGRRIFPDLFKNNHFIYGQLSGDIFGLPQQSLVAVFCITVLSCFVLELGFKNSLS
jgi:hypothetical protein